MRPIAFACIRVLGAAVLCCAHARADVGVTVATGGTNVSADNAQNAVAPAFATLSAIVIQEGATDDFAAGNDQTLILTAPTGWNFNPGTGTVSFQTGADVSAASISVSASNIVITFSVDGTTAADTLTISNIQVQASDGGNVAASGNI